MASSLNEESVEKKLLTVNNTQDSIQSLSLWIIHHKGHHSKIVELWMKVLRRSVKPSHRLTLFYLCNDVVQTCKKKKAPIYTATFKDHLREAAGLVRDLTVKNKIERIFKIWEERNIYDSAYIKSLLIILNGKPAKSKNEKIINKHLLAKAHIRKSGGKSAKVAAKEPVGNNSPISPVGSPYVPTPKADTPDTQPAETSLEHDTEESARILAEFKPHEMIEQITVFQRHEGEIRLKGKQLTHLKLDASSLEAVKQLKDRAHGNEFSGQFEDSCTKLEDLVKCQEQQLTDLKSLLETLATSETFYEAQYREARIVANAYKNFGARINNMKKKLDELKKSMPKPESPVPSPDINAPSPGSTPVHLGGPAYNYSARDSLMGYQSMGQPGGWTLNGNSTFERSGMAMDDTFQESPPLEAPSPEGSPPGLNLGGSDTGGTSLDSRLASFMDRNHHQRNIESTPSVYTPQMPRSFSSSHSKPSRQAEEDGSTTPLDDEAPTTPVQDEHSSSPPKRSTPPKKENPIDFLSRLISQSHKGPPVAKTGAASLLDSFTMLSGASKSFSQPSSADADRGDKTSSSPWPWKPAGSDGGSSTASQPSSPTGFPPIVSAVSQPTSPTFSRSLPTMVPPPIPLPVPPPPPMTPLNPPPLPPNTNLNVPPPPPPPFSLTSPPPLPYSGIPPGFPQQQTSPGQKENWPESGHHNSEQSGGANRMTAATASTGMAHTSVLKELTPAKAFAVESSVQSGANPAPPETPVSSLIDPDAMEIVSDEETDDSPMDTNSVEGNSEFASKLKQKTMAGGTTTAAASQGSAVKSHVYVPNSERPNLVTLSVSDDLDEEDMIDNNTMVEGAGSSDWASSKSHHHKSKKSRSRSRSRSKERSHKHKKKKKHKRKESDEDDFKSRGGGGDDDNRNVGSIVKRLDPRSSRNSRDSLKGDKYEDKGKYDDRKYDRYDDRKYRSDYKSSSHSQRDPNPRDPNPRDPNPRDPNPRSRDIEAYTQAFIQQYSQARYGSSYGGLSSSDHQRRSSFGKY